MISAMRKKWIKTNVGEDLSEKVTLQWRSEWHKVERTRRQYKGRIILVSGGTIIKFLR